MLWNRSQRPKFCPADRLSGRSFLNMGLQSLVLCDDEEILRQVRLILHDLGIASQTCTRPEDALDRLRRRKFELAVLDLQVSPGNMLKDLRETRSNQTILTCAIGQPPGPEYAFDLVIQLPFTIEDGWRTLRGARRLMEQEQQRYHREETRVFVAMHQKSDHRIEVQGRNLSMSGIAVNTALPVGSRPTLSFSLADDAFEVAGEIVWSAEGRSGIRFVDPPSDFTRRVETWIAARCHEREFSFVKPFRLLS